MKPVVKIQEKTADYNQDGCFSQECVFIFHVFSCLFGAAAGLGQGFPPSLKCFYWLLAANTGPWAISQPPPCLD